MFEKLVTTTSSLLKSALAVLAGGPVPEKIPPIPTATHGVIFDVEPGEGPAWGTLSGLTAHPSDPSRLFAVTDKDSAPVRIVEIEVTASSARVVRQINVTAPGYDELDPEGIVAKQDGGFWLASEGGVGNEPPNILLEVDFAGTMVRSLHLPETIGRRMPKQGIEGVAFQKTSNDARLVTAFQAPISGDPAALTRIGAVDLATGLWSFYHYPLDRSASGELTGLSELLYLGESRFAAIERDGKGSKPSIKWLTTFDLSPLTGAAPNEIPPRLAKRRTVDLVPLFVASDTKVEKEIEGLAVTVDGEVYAVTDNDNERATLLLRLGKTQALF